MNFSQTQSLGEQARLACLAFAVLSLSFGGVYFVLHLALYGIETLGNPAVVHTLASVGCTLGLALATQFSAASLPTLLPVLVVHVLVSSIAVALLYLTSGEPVFGYVAIPFFCFCTSWSLGWVYRGLRRAAPTLAPPSAMTGLAMGGVLASLALPMGPLFHQGLSHWFLSLSTLVFVLHTQEQRRSWILVGGLLLGLAVAEMLLAPQLGLALETVRYQILSQ